VLQQLRQSRTDFIYFTGNTWKKKEIKIHDESTQSSRKACCRKALSCSMSLRAFSMLWKSYEAIILVSRVAFGRNTPMRLDDNERIPRSRFVPGGVSLWQRERLKERVRVRERKGESTRRDRSVC